MVYLPHWPIPASFGNAQIDYEQVFFRLEEVLKNLDNPHQKLSPSIHITGTNGKGSTAAFLSQILRDQGYSVNLYSSPHIHHINERFLLNNAAISDSHLFTIIEEVRIANENKKITFFEAMTLVAILAFNRNKADFNIFEVGMGARIDATNIVENRAASIITPISFDHEEHLGDNIAKIAFEKAHILRPDTPLITGPQPEKAQEVIDLIATDQKAKIIKYQQDFEIEINEDDSFNFTSNNIEINNISKPGLIGQHQYINASLAITTALNLNTKLNQQILIKSTSKTNWHNRLEKIEGPLKKLLPSEDEIFIDSAHNNAGAFAISSWAKEYQSIKPSPSINIAIVGFSRNKCKGEFLKILDQSFDKIIAIRVEGEPYPEETSVIKEIGKENQIQISIAEDLYEALNQIAEIKKRKVIVICGSIHLARDLKKYN